MSDDVPKSKISCPIEQSIKAAASFIVLDIVGVKQRRVQGETNVGPCGQPQGFGRSWFQF
jgi:hypothetical protein